MYIIYSYTKYNPHWYDKDTEKSKRLRRKAINDSIQITNFEKIIRW